jgi:hypothetical protein
MKYPTRYESKALCRGDRGLYLFPDKGTIFKYTEKEYYESVYTRRPIRLRLRIRQYQ